MSDGNDILSQEEIDALMDKKDDDSDSILTEEEKDVLGEVGNVAMGSAATALYTLLDKKVDITAPEVEVLTFNEIKAEYERPCVLVKVEYIAGLEGLNLLVIDARDAAVIADLMMGGDGEDVETGKIDEIHLSAVGEAMNQMMGSSSTSMSSILDEVVNISPPEAEYIALDEVVEDDNYFDSDEDLVSISFQLQIGDLIDSSFKQLAKPEFTKQLVNSLSTEGRGLTAKEDNINQEEVASVTEEHKAQQQKKEEEKPPSREPQPEPEQPRQSKTGSTPRPSSGNVKKEEVGVKTAQFPSFDQGEGQPLPQNMDLIKDVPLEVTVRLGRAQMKIEEILDLGEGSIIELDKLAGEPVDLYVNGKLVAKGEVVVIDENFGFRVKDIISPMERINEELF